MIFLGISLISLLLFIVTAGVAFIQPQDSGDDIIFWTIFSEKEAIINTPYPVKINYIFLYILFGIPLLLALLTCACLIIYRKNIGIINGMFGTFSRFHFIPLLLVILTSLLCRFDATKVWLFPFSHNFSVNIHL